MELIKPKRLSVGDTIATVSISWGIAGESNVAQKYELGRKRFYDIFGLKVQPAQNSMKGVEYIKNNPKARADDIMWAFENKDIHAIMANIGGNDSLSVIPFIDSSVIKNNPKIFIGYSDVMNIHLLCYKAGLSTFYGHNFLPFIAEIDFHPYCEKWFRKVFFDILPIGNIEPSNDWSCENPSNSDFFENPNYMRKYYPNIGYELVQGQGVVRGKLIGGHTGIMEIENELIALSAADFENSILFTEDIPEFFSPDAAANFFKWLGSNGFLQKLSGIIIGRLYENIDFTEHSFAIKNVISNEFNMKDLPVLYGLNFGHSYPKFILPYGAEAEINCETKSFAVLESGVI